MRPTCLEHGQEMLSILSNNSSQWSIYVMHDWFSTDVDQSWLKTKNDIRPDTQRLTDKEWMCAFTVWNVYTFTKYRINNAINKQPPNAE